MDNFDNTVMDFFKSEKVQNMEKELQRRLHETLGRGSTAVESTALNSLGGPIKLNNKKMISTDPHAVGILLGPETIKNPSKKRGGLSKLVESVKKRFSKG
jgi:hypothetical protein